MQLSSAGGPLRSSPREMHGEAKERMSKVIQLSSEIGRREEEQEEKKKKPHRTALLDKQSDPSSFGKSLAAWLGWREECWIADGERETAS